MTNMTLMNLLEACCVVNGQEMERVKRKGRYREVVFTRHLFFYMAKLYFGAKLREIKVIFGFDHSTVLHGIRLIDDLIYVNDEHCVKCVEAIKKYVAEHFQLDKKLTIYVPFDVDALELSKMLQDKFGCRILQ